MEDLKSTGYDLHDLHTFLSLLRCIFTGIIDWKRDVLYQHLYISLMPIRK